MKEAVKLCVSGPPEELIKLENSPTAKYLKKELTWIKYMHRKDLKNWNEIKTNDSWSVFKIMGEFVDGYEKMGKIGLVCQYSDQLEQKKMILIIN